MKNQARAFTKNADLEYSKLQKSSPYSLKENKTSILK
jgi:hypothetical protein